MRKGFTLVELLVVISIIGILIAVVFGSFSQSQAQARDNARMTDLKNLQLAIERFRADTGSFPVNLPALAPVYVSSIPDDWGSDLQYYVTGNQDRYILTIAGVESIFTDEGHEFACPESTQPVVSSSPCEGNDAEPDDVYAVYSAGVREFSSP